MKNINKNTKTGNNTEFFLFGARCLNTKPNKVDPTIAETSKVIGI